MKVNNPIYPKINTDSLAKETTAQTAATNAANANSNATAAKTAAEVASAKIGTPNDAGTSAPTTLFAGVRQVLNHLTNIWTSARAGYIDNIRSYTLTNNTASATGVLSQKLSYIINKVAGLSVASDFDFTFKTTYLTMISSEISVAGSGGSTAIRVAFTGALTPGFYKLVLSARHSSTSTSGSIGLGVPALSAYSSEQCVVTPASQELLFYDVGISRSNPWSNGWKSAAATSVGVDSYENFTIYFYVQNATPIILVMTAPSNKTTYCNSAILYK